MSDYTFNWPEDAEETNDHSHPIAEQVRFSNGVTATLNYEEDSSYADPRGNDNIGTMYVYRPGYSLGDEQLGEDGLGEIDCPVCKGGELEIEGPEKLGVLGHTETVTCYRCDGWGQVNATPAQWARSLGAVGMMPLFIYEHSGMTIRSGAYIDLREPNAEVTREQTASNGRFVGDDAGWDTSFSGFILATEDGIKMCCGDDPEWRTPEKLEPALDAEVSEYARWLEGDVYWYEVEAEELPNGGDTCGGFIGIDYAREAATEAARGLIDAVKSERTNRADAASRDIVTVGA